MIYVLDGRRQLLTFTQPASPEAGIQIPSGTIEVGETPEIAAARELAEESGIVPDGPPVWLGVTLYDVARFKPEIHRRHWFAVDAGSNAPSEGWAHLETSGGRHKPIVFEFAWRSVDGLQSQLIAGHGMLLPLISDCLL